MEVAEPHLKNGCDDFWMWNRFERSIEVKIYGTYCRIAHFHPNWSSGTAGIRGTRVLNQGRYFWELRLNQRIFGTSMMFGIGTKKARVHADTFTNLLGEDSHSWGLSHKGLLWHGGKWFEYTKPFRENESTTVGVLFDGIAGTLTYYKDGKSLGIAFRGLNKVKEPLYPIVSSTAAKTEMRLGIMRRDYINLQDRCRTVIVKRLRHRRDLDKLLLPPLMKAYIREGIIYSLGSYKNSNAMIL
ncbi:PREDICTED: SPRY domain-containing SOCS box protein 3 [Nicrophorus vespilloides]|uniref:SPRY domain-containing SOCS box protein 3 n=1 Tax=Nicrophorus vespilloides TaxID=110193 RepID=A0ABM1NHY6_NICVS|nr:PREDICTED: SPRY domain-containing SOCS box protein 3 [Nicrophorus vespilloides]